MLLTNNSYMFEIGLEPSLNLPDSFLFEFSWAMILCFPFHLYQCIHLMRVSAYYLDQSLKKMPVKEKSGEITVTQ